MNKQWQGNTGGGSFGQRALILLFKLFGVRSLYAVMAGVVPFYMLFARRGYIAIYQYFRKQFGFAPFKAFYWTYKNHFRFGQVILDRFAVFSSRKNLFDIELIGNERFMQLLESEKGFVIVGSHVGNFEIAGYFFSQNKKKINAIVYGGEAEIVQRNRSKLLNDNNVELIPVCDDMSHLFAANIALQRGEIVSMPADRLFGSAKSVECQFLNNKANFPVGAFALATTFDIDVLAIFCIKISANKYKIFVQPLCTNVAHNAHTSKKEKISNFVQNYVSELEKIVKKYPEQWFNFYEFWKK